MHKFEKLEVWNLAIEYVDLCYGIAEQLPNAPTGRGFGGVPRNYPFPKLRKMNTKPKRLLDSALGAGPGRCECYHGSLAEAPMSTHGG